LAVPLPPAPGRVWINQLLPAEIPLEVIKLVRRPAERNDPAPASMSFPLAGNNELPKPIYCAVLRAMPLSKVERRHHRWAGSILRKLTTTTQGRNAALCRAVIEFRPLITQERISVEDAWALLVMGCAANGYLRKVGQAHVEGVILAMLRPPKERGRW
jgi:hypothetical protein